jgi:hypothetical protein
MLELYVHLLFVWPVHRSCFLFREHVPFFVQGSLFPWLCYVTLVGCLFSGACSLEQACLYMPLYFDLLFSSCVSLLIYIILIFDKKKKGKSSQ